MLKAVLTSQTVVPSAVHAWVEEAARVGDGVRVADVARAAGVSVRTVYRSSARHLGGPPMRQIRLRRLQRVRRRLRAAAPGDTVTSAAMDAGFFHLGRFADTYRRHFGESPSATLRRARGTGRADSGSSGRVTRNPASRAIPVAPRA